MGSGISGWKLLVFKDLTLTPLEMWGYGSQKIEVNDICFKKCRSFKYIYIYMDLIWSSLYI